MKVNIVVPLEPRTKKNHQRILKNNRTGKCFVAPSEQYKDYLSAASWYIKGLPKPIDTPVEVTCRFYMKTHRRVDLTNLLEAIDDILVSCGVLADDNSNIIVSHDGSRVLYDKENPRTEITIREVN